MTYLIFYILIVPVVIYFLSFLLLGQIIWLAALLLIKILLRQKRASQLLRTDLKMFIEEVSTLGIQPLELAGQTQEILLAHGQYAFSLFLDLLSGYGFKAGRSLFIYMFVILVFTITYFYFGHLPIFPDALVFSLTSFHGRGFFPGLGNNTSLHNPIVVLAAFEAVIGLFVEISFIATFTQRYFGK